MEGKPTVRVSTGWWRCQRIRLLAARLRKPAGSGFRSLERGAIAVHLHSDGVVISALDIDPGRITG